MLSAMENQPYRSIVSNGDNVSRTSVSRQLSRDEWEEVKPLIYRLYIEEEKTFKIIKPIIAEKYGCIPTRTQFDKRVQRWGFKKNAPKQEIISNNASSSSGYKPDGSGTHRQVVTSAKCEQRALELGDSSRNIVHSGVLMDKLHNASFHRLVESEVVGDHEMNATPSRIVELPSVDAYSSDEIMTSTGIAGPEDAYSWDSVNAFKHARLSQLFSALGIYVPGGLPFESLSTSEQAAFSSKDATKFILPSDLIISPPTNLRKFKQDLSMELSLSHQKLTHSELKRHTQGSLNILFPREDWVSPNPYNELSPFPPSKIHPPRVVGFSSLSMASLTAQANRLQAYLASFRGILPQAHPIILKAMESLASSFSDMDNYIESCVWWEKIVTCREGSRDPEALNAMFQLLKNLKLVGVGKSQEADMLEPRLGNLIQQNLPSGHPVALDFMLLKQSILGNRGQNAEGDVLCRQALQISLSQWGLRNPRTITSLIRTARTLSMKIQTSRILAHSQGEQGHQNSSTASDCEFLMQTAVQLFAEVGDSSDKQAISLNTMHITILTELDRYQDVLNLAKDSVERSKITLGEEHSATMRYMSLLGIAYLKLGRFQECIDTLQTVVKHQKLDQSFNDPVYSIQLLGEAFQGLNSHQEAVVHLGEAYWTFLSYFGSLNAATNETCRLLGSSYIQLGQYDEALKLYYRYIEEILGVANNDHPFILEAGGWIDCVNSLLIEGDVVQVGRTEIDERYSSRFQEVTE